MLRQFIAALLILAIPSAAAAGPLRDAVERAGRTAMLAQGPEPVRGRSGRFWTGIALIAGGGLLIALGAFEVGDEEDDPSGEDDDDNGDDDDADDGEDGDGLHNAMLGAGIGAAAVGGVLLLTGGNSGGSPSKTGIVLRHTLRF
jgi:hypothetical protein